MVRGWDDFGDTHKESLEYLEPMQVPWNELCDVQHAKRKMCACVRTVRRYLYTSPSRSRHLPVSGREIWLRKKKTMADECARPQKMRTLATVETIFARSWIPGAKMNMNLSLSVFTIFPTTFGLAILLVATLASVETFSKC